MSAPACRPARAGFVGAALMMAACGPERLHEAALDRICDAPGPVQLLALDPDRPPVSLDLVPAEGDRHVLELSFADAALVDYAPPTHTEVWSVGACGEDPRRLTEGTPNLFGPAPNSAIEATAPEGWAAASLWCDGATGEVLSLDPQGEQPPHRVFELAACYGFVTPHGIVALVFDDQERAALQLQPWPDDPWGERPDPVHLLDDVRWYAEATSTLPAFLDVTFAAGDVAFAITQAGDLVRLALPGGEPTVEASDVVSLASSPSGRFIGWRTASDAVYVRDRDTGRTELLSEDPVGPLYGPLRFADDGILQLRVDESGTTVVRVWRWPSMDSFDLDEDQSIGLRFSDGRFLVGTFFGGPYAWLDPSTGVSEPLLSAGGLVRSRQGEDGVEILQAGLGSLPEEGELWWVSPDDEPRLLAPAVTRRYQTRSDDTVLTLVDVGASELGTLVAVDPDTHEDGIVARHVDALRVTDDDEVVYTVVDGDRTGVWIAKLAD